MDIQPLEGFAEESGSGRAELAGEIRDEDSQGASVARGTGGGTQHLGQGRGSGLGAIHDGHIVTQQLGGYLVNRLGQQRIVSAAEDDRVDVCIGQGLQVSPGRKLGDLAAGPAFFGQRYE